MHNGVEIQQHSNQKAKRKPRNVCEEGGRGDVLACGAGVPALFTVEGIKISDYFNLN